MMELWNFLTVHIPWQIWLTIFGTLLVFAAILFQHYGIKTSLLWIVGGVAAILVLLARATQQGYGLRKTDEQTANTKAVDQFNQIHQQNEAKNDQQLDQQNDPWLKP